jgi:ubiquinone/menaquinone biosynthesis C-methylase UbiE
MSDFVKKDVQAQFGRNAESYVISQGHAKGDDLKKLLEIFRGDEEDHVLDVATGGGHVANALAPIVKQVTALDLTAEILRAAEKFINGNGHVNVSFVQGDAEAMPFADQSFDMVTCRIAAHHFPRVHQFIHEVMRVLKKGGEFYLIDNVAPEEEEMDHFYNEVEKRRDYSHQRALKKSEWIKGLELQGFEIYEMYSFKKKFNYDPWCDRMKLDGERKESLTRFMLNTSAKIKNKFSIEQEDNRILSFYGESVLIRAVKPDDRVKAPTTIEW